jgi:hypothetical protein
MALKLIIGSDYVAFFKTFCGTTQIVQGTKTINREAHKIKQSISTENTEALLHYSDRTEIHLPMV